MIGLIVVLFGLVTLQLSVISLAQGFGVLTALAGIVVGLLAIVAGNRVYKRWRRRFISKREVARLFGVSDRTVDYWLREGKLPKPKRKLRLRRWNYEELVALRKFKKDR